MNSGRIRSVCDDLLCLHPGGAPLLFATGAGAAGQGAIGTVVFGGMLSSTLLAIPFVPVFYVIMQSLSERRGNGKTPSEPKGDVETGNREKKDGETR